VDLARPNIERRDFTSSRRGYDRDQVDAHLRAIADAVETLKEPGPSTGGVAAERVQAIVEAAEASAREIEERARAEAEGIRAGAGDDVARAREAAALISERAGALERELEELAAQLRTVHLSAPAPEPGPPDAEPEIAEEVVAETAPAADPGRPAEGRPTEGARLIALNMALSGTPREETARYLRENFDLESADALLDDVYSRAGG